MMTPRKKLFLILGGSLLIILLMCVWWLVRHRTPAEVETPRDIPPVRTTNTPPAPPSEQIASDERVGTANLQTLAKTFAARYGSYSTDAVGENLLDVLPLMTSEFAERTKVQLATRAPGSEYYGVSTRVVSIRIVDNSETEAVLDVSTQREEAKGNPQNSSIVYQTLTLHLVKAGDEWLVSDATWN